MKMSGIVTIGTAFGLALLNGASAFAQPGASQAGTIATNACVTAVAGCLSRAEGERSECFHDVSQSSPCAGQELGKLAFRRWALAPHSGSENTQSFALLGPQLVDKQCLANFDTQLSSELILGTPSVDSLQMLTARLDGCREQAAEDVFRP